jgi:CelD/BcsL family acetyltransferase involved in cellulose biosynthesis
MSASALPSPHPRAASPAGAPAVQRMPLLDALALGPEVWDALCVEPASPFMSWAWHRAWADAGFEGHRSEAFVLRDAAGSGAQAILPVSRRRLPFHRVPVTALTWAIGDTGCPDYLDVLAAPGADLAALVPGLEALDWQVIVLSNLAPNAHGAVRLCEALAERGHRVQREPLWACPYLELASDWESYLAGLSKKRRQALRYMERHLRRHYAVAITDYGADRLEEGWGHLVALHARRWSENGVSGGAFQDPRIDGLHRRFAAELARRGQLWLTTLDVDGAPAAAWYGFTGRDTVYFYQCGRDPRWERESVGQILIGAMMRRGMERGFRRFDFLRGDDPYKQHWTTTRRMTEEITVFRRGWRGRWLRGLNAVAELRARLRKPADA